jgi:hypothetical protein
VTEHPTRKAQTRTFDLEPTKRLTSSHHYAVAIALPKHDPIDINRITMH